MPPPKSAKYQAALHDEIEALILAAEGRTLVLFSSYAAMNTAADDLSGRLSYRILRQGDLPPPELLRQFSATNETCLFGTFTFWQGVDLPGETLSQVIIAKLPFPRPDDPMWQARRATFERTRRNPNVSTFAGVDIPFTATKLAQGAGRLIRSESDRGVISILDSRSRTAGYAKSLMAGLPPFKQATGQKAALDFLREL